MPIHNQTKGRTSHLKIPRGYTPMPVSATNPVLQVVIFLGDIIKKVLKYRKFIDIGTAIHYDNIVHKRLC